MKLTLGYDCLNDNFQVSNRKRIETYSNMKKSDLKGVVAHERLTESRATTE